MISGYLIMDECMIVLVEVRSLRIYNILRHGVVTET